MEDCIQGIALINSSGTIVLQGKMTNTNQPSFGVYSNSGQSNVTGDSTRVTVTFDTEEFDNASNFVTSTFTAPTAGRYHLDTTVGIKESTSTCSAFLVTSTGTFSVEISTLSRMSLSVSKLLYMAPNDTARVDLICSGGSKVVDILGSNQTLNGTGRSTFFSGYLAN